SDANKARLPHAAPAQMSARYGLAGVSEIRRGKMGDRGSGRTRRAMEDAKRGAIYIWCNGVLSYPMALARHIGRDDLKIYSPSVLEDDRLRGVIVPEII